MARGLFYWHASTEGRDQPWMDHLVPCLRQGAEQKEHLTPFRRSCTLMLYSKKAEATWKSGSPGCQGHAGASDRGGSVHSVCCSLAPAKAGSAHGQGFPPKTMFCRALEPCRRQLCVQPEGHPQQTGTFTAVRVPDRAGPVTSCLPQLTRDLLHLLYWAK